VDNKYHLVKITGNGLTYVRIKYEMLSIREIEINCLSMTK